LIHSRSGGAAPILRNLILIENVSSNWCRASKIETSAAAGGTMERNPAQNDDESVAHRVDGAQCRGCLAVISGEREEEAEKLQQDNRLRVSVGGCCRQIGF